MAASAQLLLYFPSEDSRSREGEAHIMAAKKILYATDYSEPSRAALCIASSLARDEDTTLLIVHVSELEEFPEGESFDEDSQPSPAELAQLRAVQPGDTNLPCEYRRVYGKPAEAIVKLARVEGVTKIVIGTHGRTGLARLLAGSVAEAVIRNATCPVVVVKSPLNRTN